ncbi:alpha/beta hydrolase [Sediminicola sp. 1XM1-17]|uniref:alpha/beta hydrolase n=1 Tax=Sediminicola sp. 1XM1-17 TaxID=3127702 RepID=UPI003077FA31
MNSNEKQVTYTISNTYSTLNELTEQTKRVWFVFHGLGQLSTYFIRYFNELPSKENYIIAPQAQSKYYLNSSYSRVGACWLTKNNTGEGIENALEYIDTVHRNEKIPARCELIILGFSQGVSMATRWVASRKLECHHLVLYAGSLPKELIPADFAHLLGKQSKVTSILGDTDAYINEKRRHEEDAKTEHLFQGRATLVHFEGGHEIKKEIINAL